MVDVALSSILPNPFRDFDLHPFDQNQIDRLQASIDADGFWASVVARKAGNRYELAFGHHRVEAARALGWPRVPIEVRELSDWQMVRMLATENATQRGVSTAATLDAIQAVSRVAAYHLLRWDEATFGKNFPKVALNYPSCRGRLQAGSGIGHDCIQAFLPRGSFTENQIREQLRTLKDSGRMTEIVAAAKERAESELIGERAMAETRLIEAEAKQARARGKAQRQITAQVTAKAKRLAAQTVKAIEATGKALAAIERQPITYDARCAQLFKLESHATTFREIVTGETFQSYLPLAQQYDFAKAVLATLHERVPNRDITADGIRAECWARIESGLGLAKQWMRTAPERPHLQEIRDGLNYLRRAGGDYTRAVALLMRAFATGQRLDAKQMEQLDKAEAAFNDGWAQLRPHRQKPGPRLVETEGRP